VVKPFMRVCEVAVAGTCASMRPRRGQASWSSSGEFRGGCDPQIRVQIALNEYQGSSIATKYLNVAEKGILIAERSCSKMCVQQKEAERKAREALNSAKMAIKARYLFDGDLHIEFC